MDVHEELRALGPKLDAVENDIVSTVRQLSTVLAELDAPNLEGKRERFLLDEKTRLSKREELLRVKEQQLRKEKEDLRARLPAPQQQGAEPPTFFQKKN